MNRIALAVLLIALVAVGVYVVPDNEENGERMDALFSYGTLLDPDVQRRVIGRVVEIRPDTLPGYRKGVLQLTESSYFIAIPDPDGVIEGGVLLVTPDELARIDRYEGEHYERVLVELASGVEAWVYRRHAPPATDATGRRGPSR